MSSTSDSAVGDRRGLSTRTALVRVAALVGFTLYVLALVLANLFYGFDGTLERLLLLSIGHLLLAPLAFIASMRLGPLIAITMVVAGLVLALDVTQLIIRAFRAESSIEYIALLAVNIVLAGVSVLYLIGLARLRQWDRELNNTVTDSDTKEKRAAMIRQESNALRAIAVFDLIAVIVVTITLAVFGSFSTTLQAYALFYLGHLLVLGLALFGAPVGGFWLPAFMLVALIQTALDLLQLVLRLLAQPGDALVVVSLENIISTVLLVISAMYIIIDIAYLTSGFGLIAAGNVSVELDTESAPLVPSKKTASAAAVGVRQRNKHAE